MPKSFALLFQLKRTKMQSGGTAPIYLRITIEKERVEIATKRSIDPERWNSLAQKVTGNNPDARSINAHLKTLEQKPYEVYREMIEKKIPINS
ncbi:Arm DNA-binding domain-containing protein [Mucilaginibacter sp. R-33]|uniref:Arm DNA-binding domain-containing protein n=1 Tax=unclassified Mucilaginibacter TaxID=2617802 RepID=UPI003CFA8A7A